MIEKNKKIIRIILFAALLIAIIGCDQITKNMVRQNIEYNSQINIVGHYLILTKVENKGAFLGLGNALPPFLFQILMIILPLFMMGYALYYVFIKNNLSRLFVTAIGFIVGGGVGNLWDRIVHGSVTDFLYFDFVLFHTGIVNMADISVTIGFFMLVFDLFFNRDKKTHPTGVNRQKTSLLKRAENFISKKMKSFAAIQMQYESKRTLFNLPLISINLGFDQPDGRIRQARGIIAVGARASGVAAVGTVTASGLFALAPLAFGGLTISIFSIGFVCVSCLGIGALSVSVFAFGYIAVGVLAVGLKSVGIMAFGQYVTGIIGWGQYQNLLFPF